jgi:hypothetical protein
LGAAVGFLFGDMAVPELKHALGDVLDDVVLAIGGAFLGGLIHELAMPVRG